MLLKIHYSTVSQYSYKHTWWTLFINAHPLYTTASFYMEFFLLRTVTLKAKHKTKNNATHQSNQSLFQTNVLTYY